MNWWEKLKRWVKGLARPERRLKEITRAKVVDLGEYRQAHKKVVGKGK